ncbi:MAG: patatin-like phospholipase family protein [Bdellovibrionales bacterium]
MGKEKTKKTINLALQGGGAHGAFTWGVLDYILQDDRLDIEGISATSAGAMNAAAFAHGQSVGGAAGARETLEHFWSEIAKTGSVFSPVKGLPWDMSSFIAPTLPAWMQGWNADFDNTLSFSMFENMTRSVSPYQFNPMGLNPLKDVLEKTIDFNAVHDCKCVKLFITATDVQTGTAKIFQNEEVSIDALLASAALPFLFQAVEIDGRYYWDGGYTGNPSLWPLFYNAQCRDILMVHVNPILREDLPKQAYAIDNRLNEITFNVALLKELRAVDFVQKLLDQDMLKDEYKDRYKNILLHAIRADDAMTDLSVASKFDTDWGFLTHLRDLGRDHAKAWLKKHFKAINKAGTVNIAKDYLNA